MIAGELSLIGSQAQENLIWTSDLPWKPMG
jgi:hypothetical protein